MKSLLYRSIAVWILTVPCMAEDPPPSIIERYHQIVALVKTNDARTLAGLVQYPLKRENPLPDITTPDAFVEQYPIIFDQEFRKKFDAYTDACIFERHGSYGLVGGPFWGEVWLTDEGKIGTINYSSAEESKRKEQLIAQIKEQMHPSVRDWQRNIFFGKHNNLTVRVDETTKGIRYASWSKGHPVSEKPDLVLYNGVAEAQGTMGGWTWTFVNGQWTYVVDDAEMCEEADQCGYFLRLYFGEEEKSSMKLVPMKQ